MKRTGFSYFIVATATVAAVVLFSRTLIAQNQATPQRARTGNMISSPDAVGIIVGTAWKSDTEPYPLAKLRLRNVENGEAAARTESDKAGQFRFEHVRPGPYVVELVAPDERVLATGQLFAVSPGTQAITLVRLGSKAPWFGGFFGNTAAAVLAAASTLGVTALGSDGRPASGQ